MSKSLYLAHWDMVGGDGITKKIRAQISALNEVHKHCDFVILGQKSVYSNVTSKSTLRDIVRDLARRYDFVYVRNCNGYGTLKLLYILGNINSERVVYEIPTYPYWGEIVSLTTKLEYLFKKLFIRFFIDKIVYIGSAEEKIWGVTATSITNCISWPIEPVTLIKKKIEDENVQVVGVASQAIWHGYDRFIEGMSIYPKSNVIFHIVGDGPSLIELKSLVQRLNLTDNVIFHGRLDGEELNHLLLNMDCGIDSLARHRVGVTHNSSLKAKEYLAYGLPVVMSHIDLSILNLDFVMRVSESDTPISVDNILDLVRDNKTCKTQIQDFAYDNFSWVSVFSELV
jgi:glycosyltransferase involved in cell wall biosynthesis